MSFITVVVYQPTRFYDEIVSTVGCYFVSDLVKKIRLCPQLNLDRYLGALNLFLPDETLVLNSRSIVDLVAALDKFPNESRMLKVLLDDPTNVKAISPSTTVNFQQALDYRESGRPLKSTDYSATSRYIKISQDYLDGTGFECDLNPGDKKILFCRSEFHRLYKFLTTEILQSKRVGYVIGAPGTGKSMTVMAYISSLDPITWKILWIHLDKRVEDKQCTLFEPDTKKQFSLNLSQISEMIRHMLSDQSIKHMIVVDGLTNDTDYKVLESVCFSWRRKSIHRNYLIFACSMGSRQKCQPQVDKVHGIEEFTMCSWKLEELQESVKDPPFLNQVQKYLDVGQRQDPIERRVLAKYFYSGGSVRFMFQFPTKTVVAMLQNAFADFKAVTVYSGAKETDETTLNLLISIFREDPGAAPQLNLLSDGALQEEFEEEKQVKYSKVLLSRYVSNTVVSILGPKHVDLLKYLL
jgi:hypothetical protein